MKKVLSVMAVSAFVLTAGVALAGGPGKKTGPGCPDACQTQIDDLNSSQAQQNEQLGAHGKMLQNHEGRITALEKAAYDPWFIRVGARASWMSADTNWNNWEVDTDTGWGGALAFGREFNEFKNLGRFRAEVEVAYQSNDLDFGSSQVGRVLQANTRDMAVDVWTFMVNGYYEIPVADAFSVYAMVGMGLANASIDGEYWDGAGYVDLDNDGSNAFAYKAGVGITYNFTDTVAGDLGYEYLGISDVGELTSIGGSNVVASVRFKF